jgi:hypothetical protein
MSAKSGTTAFLSQLDGYICALFDRYFIYLCQRHATVRFEYDYHRLKRWLLKMSFNSARVHESRISSSTRISCGTSAASHYQRGGPSSFMSSFLVRGKYRGSISVTRN